MRVCHETIYQAIYHSGSPLGARMSITTAGMAAPLRTGRTRRRGQRRTRGQRRRFEQPMLSIRQRPFAPEDRDEPGHWEGDLIVGRRGNSAVATLVERSSRLVMLVKITARDSEAVTAAVGKAFEAVPPVIRKSLSWDQGQEMARHKDFSETVGMPVYFCDPHSPWQRGSNENTNAETNYVAPEPAELEFKLTRLTAWQKRVKSTAKEKSAEVCCYKIIAGSGG